MDLKADRTLTLIIKTYKLTSLTVPAAKFMENIGLGSRQYWLSEASAIQDEKAFWNRHVSCITYNKGGPKDFEVRDTAYILILVVIKDYEKSRTSPQW